MYLWQQKIIEMIQMFLSKIMIIYFEVYAEVKHWSFQTQL